MAAYNKYHIFVQDVMHKIHDMSADQLTVALSNTTPNPVTHTELLDASPIDDANASPLDLTRTSSGQTGGVYSYVLENLTITATGGPLGPFQYIVIYNSTTVGGNLICWYDYGSGLTLQDTESLEIQFVDSQVLFDLE